MADDQVTAMTHNYPEGTKGARATTHAIWPAFQRAVVRKNCRTTKHAYGYDLSRTVDQMRPGYSFDQSCPRMAPEAITCALEATSFEDAVRNAISLGGDTDTLATIAGAVAKAMHGVPAHVVAAAMQNASCRSPVRSSLGNS